MTTVADIVGWLESFAPVRLAEPWDNVGLLWGDPAQPVDRVMTCLTVTKATAAEAIRERAQLIISHHPVLFREVKRIRADLPETAHLWMLARAGIAIASPHTAFDNTHEGINEILCKRLGVVDVKPLRPAGSGSGAKNAVDSPASYKVVVFTPESDREAVSAGAFAAGAGTIGAYEECSFAIPGEGTFFGTEAASPTVGERGRRETVHELRLEFITPASRLAAVLAAIRASHSYEEPAIDVYPLHQPEADDGKCAVAGRIGRLARPCTAADLAVLAGQVLGSTMVALAGDPHRPVERVAVCCGGGDDFLKDAARAGADILVTGEARFHRAIEAWELGIGLLTAGHHATERPGVEELAQRVARAFPAVLAWASKDEQDPLLVIDTRIDQRL
jgi:dinuclear metal center YbgI/SA1388 family protein